MKFRDGVERDPDDYGYIILKQKDLDTISKKRDEIPDYKKSLEYVKEFTQIPTLYLYKIKFKDLDIAEGFHEANLNYVCRRSE
ncbi:hypothetical protein LDB17_01265 [Dysgonomonas sp. Shenzhen-Wh21]|uniref:hypothetical protein n=1 Tax=Dysgonomonas TaxID=156973 RepID=UPI00208F4D85|nr:hypothetical protein [Dysgonomonas mossii]